MDKTDKNGYTYVTFTEENVIESDPEEYKKCIIKAANEISDRYGWGKIDEIHYGELRLDNINNFIFLLDEISQKSGDMNWLINYANEELYKPLLQQFLRKRDKDYTNKAVYCLFCIGLIEDITINHISHTYSFKIIKRNNSEYYQHLKHYFDKYYYTDSSLQREKEVKAYKFQSEYNKCIGYLTDLEYDTLVKKRRRVIEVIRNSCHEDTDTDGENFKNYIHLYFISKYNRKGYEVNGKKYSLSDDIKAGKRNDIELVNKYFEVINIDDSGNKVDNVKHLCAAVLINLRDNTDNFSLHLLRAFCLAFLGIDGNEILYDDFKTSILKEGFIKMAEIYESKEIFSFFDKYNQIIKDVCNDDSIVEYVEEVRNKLSLVVYGNWFIKFSNEYIKQ